MVSREAVDALRKSTGAGMNQCKYALTLAGGNMDDATELLRYDGTSRYGETLAHIRAKQDHKRREALYVMEKGITRLEILMGRMDACGPNAHELSLVEVPGWVEEQREALNVLRGGSS